MKIKKIMVTILYVDHVEQKLTKQRKKENVCCCLGAKLCLTLFGPHGLYCLPSSSVHGISQARILELNCHFLLQRECLQE